MVDLVDLESRRVFHVVAMPYPGRGHINPMINFCKLLVSRKPDILITFIITEEWLAYISTHPKPDAIRIATVPNVLPSERDRALDFPGYYEAVMTKMEAPFEQLLDHLEPPVTAIIGDIELRCAIDLGNRRNIPVAALWTMPATFFSILHHFHLFAQNQDSPIDLLVETAENIPGISSSNLAELRAIFRRNDLRVLQLALECISKVHKARYLLFTSVYELEAKAIDTLKATFPFPVYSIGPAIPYLQLEASSSGANYSHNSPDYQKWLDCQPEGSVLYISLGSFLSVSRTQMDEMVAGLQDCSVRYLWVAREEAYRLKEICSDKGLVLPWCDQLKVLCHPSVGGFWTHCGWNSTLEAIFAGVPMLTFPLFLDQHSNSRQIVDEWRIGWKVQEEMREEHLVIREEISQLVQQFMDLESSERKGMSRRAKQLKSICHLAIAEGGSSVKNTDAFIGNILQEICV
ncbi:UDP-glycosyltransferase 87A1 [Ricinus communis]|uniref:UDP-glycosyltransferase 87A1 n=1 Tax=Ricinus communis TaxID=3988 RepID=UPI00201A7FB4|nr:UDP-glycosyltransferase 87A1 [Ricinus communis]